jgi:hypothetical protein
VSEVGGSDHIGFLRSGYAREYVELLSEVVTDLYTRHILHFVKMDNDEKMMQQIMEILIKMNAAADADRE